MFVIRERLYAHPVYQYKNIKEKLYKTNAAIWQKKMCIEHILPPARLLT